ncbi:hypothetical protein BYT27DRAFT_6684549 [Phlegmacium glaucopus]|nr:hypothetical protein BYT27DRAFT_6684549 [Phlegmacium glaucopus]
MVPICCCFLRALCVPLLSRSLSGPHSLSLVLITINVSESRVPLCFCCYDHFSWSGYQERHCGRFRSPMLYFQVSSCLCSFRVHTLLP